MSLWRHYHPGLQPLHGDCFGELWQVRPSCNPVHEILITRHHTHYIWEGGLGGLWCCGRIGHLTILEPSDPYHWRWRLTQTSRRLSLCHGAVDIISWQGELIRPITNLHVNFARCGAWSLLVTYLLARHGPSSGTMSVLGARQPDRPWRITRPSSAPKRT